MKELPSHRTLSLLLVALLTLPFTLPGARKKESPADLTLAGRNGNRVRLSAGHHSGADHHSLDMPSGA